MISSKKIGKGFLQEESGGIDEAPEDGVLYGRKDKTWEAFPEHKFNKPIKQISGTSEYTFELEDKDHFLVFEAALSSVVVPKDVFAKGDEIEGTFQASNVTINEGTDVLIQKPASLTLEYERWGVFGLKCMTVNRFVAFGTQIPV